MVQRYDPEFENGGYNKMELCDSGDYVLYEDYEELADKLADTQVELEWFKKRLRRLIRRCDGRECIKGLQDKKVQR